MHLKISFTKRLTILLAAILLTSALFNFEPSKFPADDGFFYLQIANNIVEGKGSSFHSISETNGYHPLWMVFCVGAAYINPFGKMALLHFAWLMQILLFLGAIILLQSIKSKKDYHLSDIFLAFIFIGLGTIYLSEAFLLLFLFSLFIIHILKFEYKTDVKKYIITGFLSSLVFLSRLDSVFVLLVLLFYYLFIKNKPKVINVFLTFLGGAFLSFPYLIWNKVKFHSFIPISGKIKSYFPQLNLLFDHFGMISLILVTFQLGYYSIFFKGKYKGFYISLNIGVLIHLLYTYLFQDQSSGWYWVTAYLAISLFINDVSIKTINAINEKLAVNLKPVFNILFVFSLSLIFLSSYLKLNYNFSVTNVLVGKLHLKKTLECPIKLFARKLKNEISEKSNTVFVFDAPGKLAFYSDLSIFSADGLVNSFGYSEELKEKGALVYFKENNIKFILTPFSKNETLKYDKRLNVEFNKNNEVSKLTIHSPLLRVPCGDIELYSEKLIATYPSPLFTWNDTYDQVALWSID